MRAYHAAVRGFNFKVMTYQKVISAPFSRLKTLFQGRNKGYLIRLLALATEGGPTFRDVSLDPKHYSKH